MTTHAFNLPATIGKWNRSDSVKMINNQNIFNYMNGAGELYLSYGFDHLQVYEYKNPDQADILVEVYLMKSSDEAFGLLSLDWGGEPVETGSTSQKSSKKTSISPPHRALYGSGLLRAAFDSIYVRIMSYQETPEARKAILSLHKVMLENRTSCPEPELLKRLPLELASDYQLRKDRIGYFHSYLVLNMLYYISHQNVLNLDHSTNVVFAPYEQQIDSQTKKKVQFLLIQYPDKAKAVLALEQFHNAYLPEFKKEDKILKSNSYKIEDGVVCYRLDENYLTILFELDDLELAKTILSRVSQN
ncbi:MAG: hypothetical protein GY729_22000 [Desulfobacteraceae bacterium]|nr:hypothetical protein [Desulfobacteraceae bacterium]